MSNLTLLLSKMLGSRKGAAVAPPTYTISGTIVDGAAAGIENVTVALTGDATDSATTNSSGEYTFSGVSNGSYTVTPTLSNYSFTPASRNVSVSGSNASVDSMVGATIIIFSKNYDAATLDQAPPGTSTAVGTPLVKAISNDSGGYTPPGFSRCVEAAGNQVVRVAYAISEPTSTGVYRSEAVLQADNSTGLGIYVATIVDANDQMWTSFIKSSETKEYKATVNGSAKTYGTQAVTITSVYWMIIQTEWSFSTSELKCRIIVPGATQDTGWHTKSIGDWDDGAATELMTTFTNTAAGSKFRLAQFWMARGAVDFPEGAKQAVV